MNSFLLLRKIISVGLVGFFIITARAWLYPETVGLLGNIGNNYQDALLFGCIIILLVYWFFRDDLWVIYLILFSTSLLIINNINFLQPWTYQLVSIILIIAITKKTSTTFFAAKMIVISLYFHSGFNKINSSYIYEIFPLVFGFENISNMTSFIIILAIASIVIEIVCALFLIFKKSQKIGFFFVVLISLINIYLFSFGFETNISVVFWNILMIPLSYTLFYRKYDPITKQANSLSKILVYGICTLFFVGPFFSGYLWPSGLSFHLYSEPFDTYQIYIPISEKGLLDNIDSKYFIDSSAGYERFNIGKFILYQKNILPFNSLSNYQSIFKRICEHSSFSLFVHQPHEKFWRKDRDEIIYTCS